MVQLRSVRSSFARAFLFPPLLLACGSHGPFDGDDAAAIADAAQDPNTDAQQICSSGRVDTSFGDEGIISIFGLEPDKVSVATGVAIDAQSRIVVSGGFIAGARSCVLARFLPNGTPDPSFGVNGIVRQSVDQHVCWFNKVAIQQDGDIVAIGDIDGHTEPRAVVARYRTDGQLDQSFGDGGLVILEPTLVTSGLTTAVTPDANIVIGGQIFEDPTASFLVRKYTSVGFLDSSFGDGGIAEPAFVNGRDTAHRVVVQSDGKLMVAGVVGTASSTMFGVVRYRTDGSRDPMFGSAGVTTIPFGAHSGATGIVLDSLGRYVVVGGTTTGVTTIGAAISRLTSEGLLDTTFGDAGRVFESSLPGFSFSSVATQGVNDEILAVGTWNAGSSSIALARYTTNGVLDASFGTNGFAESLPLSTWRQIGWDLAVQPDGRIVVVGGYGDLSRFDMLVARYCP